MCCGCITFITVILMDGKEGGLRVEEELGQESLMIL